MKKLIRDGRKDTQTDYNNKFRDKTIHNVGRCR